MSASAETAAPLSVLVLTRDEEADLPGCLGSVAWCDDVQVLDSLSADRTAELARSLGATVSTRLFDGYASQRNHGLHALPWRHPWVLILDADERVPAALADELRRTLPTLHGSVAGLRLRRRDHLMGRWLRHAQITPWYIRVVRPERARYTREINEVLEVDGAVATLRESFDHFPFGKGLEHWFAKHNRYSTMEAREVLRAGDAPLLADLRAALLDRDFHRRRAAQKRVFFRLPFRPQLKWLYMVLGRRAFLDGRAGMAYVEMQCIYERMIALKARELRRTGAP